MVKKSKNERCERINEQLKRCRRCRLSPKEAQQALMKLVPMKSMGDARRALINGDYPGADEFFKKSK